jgi:hypothetical protein
VEVFLVRRIAGLLLSLVLLVTMAATGSAASGIRVLFDEQEVQFDANPFIEAGRTLVPVRALAERLGFTVGWDQPEQKITLTKGDSTILLWIGSSKVVVNGKEGTVDVAPKQVGNRTFVPVRFVAERLGAHVTWDQQQQAAVVTSGKSLLLKLSTQQKPVDQKTTGDFQMQIDVTSPDAPNGGSFSAKMPVHLDMHVYHNDMLMGMNISVSAPGQSTSVPFNLQMAVKDGKMYSQNPMSLQWQEMGSVDPATGAPDLDALMGQAGFADLMKIQTQLLQDAVVSVAGREAIDGVNAIRLDADLSKVKFGDFLDKLFASMPLPPSGGKPAIKMNVDRYLVHYWINPETLFVHKTTLDMAMGVTITDAGKTTSAKIDVKGEMRGMPVSEPITFPDLSAPTVTAEQQQAAQVYWDALQKDVPMEPCMTAASDADAHWADKSFAAGRDASAKAVSCFVQHRTALTAMKPPTDFADAQTALSLALEASEKSYVAFGQAFDLAAKGDMTASDTKKADADKLQQSAEQALMQAVMKTMQAAAKYDLK